MIHAIFVQLRDALAAKGVPFQITYGPPQTPMKVGDTRLAFFRDYTAGDAIGPRKSQHQNPRQIATRSMTFVVRIYAQSTKPAAARWEHEEIAEQLADAVHVALHDIALRGRTLMRIGRMGYVQDDTSDGWLGVVYEIRFQIDRGVADLTWTGEAAPEAIAGSMSTSLDVDGPGAATDLPSATTRIT